MNKNEFLKLLKKYNDHTASDEERRFVEAYYNLLELNKNTDNDILNDLLEGQILDRVWERIHKEDYATSKIRKLAYFRRIAAAVIVLIAVGAAFYLLRGDKNKNSISNNGIATTPSTIITPAHKKAVLTLANGKNIVLGTNINKTLSKAVKQDSDRIIYQNIEGEIAKGTEYNTLTTPHGGEFKVVLSDGTNVWLNAGSSLYYPVAFNGEKRIVELKGEAYFEVARQKNHPFIVKVGNSEVQVLGTHFNIRAYDELGTINTTLTEGKVRIVKAQESKLLSPGEQAIISRNSSEIQLHEANIDAVLAWKNNLFYFDNTNIKEIMNELSRWYNVSVMYNAENLKSLNFSGVMSRYEDIDAVLERLSLTGTVHFAIEGKTVVVK